MPVVVTLAEEFGCPAAHVPVEDEVAKKGHNRENDAANAQFIAGLGRMHQVSESQNVILDQK